MDFQLTSLRSLCRASRYVVLGLLLPSLASCAAVDDGRLDDDDRVTDDGHVVHIAYVRSGTHAIDPDAQSAHETWATGISCVNISSEPTHIRVRWPDSRVDESCEPIVPGQSYKTFSRYENQMDGGASVFSDQAVRCTVNVHTEAAAAGPGPFATYEAARASSRVLFVQALALDGWVGEAVIHNPTDRWQRVGYMDGPTEHTPLIAPRGHHRLLLAKPFNGSVEVRTIDDVGDPVDGEIVGVSLWRDLSGESQSFSAMTGLTAEQGARTVYVPRASVRHLDRKSGITIQNAGSEPTNLTLRTFFPLVKGCVPTPQAGCVMREEVFENQDFLHDPDGLRLDDVEQGEGVKLFVPDMFGQANKPLPQGDYGTIIVESSSSDIVVTVNENVFGGSHSSHPYGASHTAPTEPSVELSFAQVVNLSTDANAPFVSEIQFANASAQPGTCTLKAGSRKTTVAVAPHGVFHQRATAFAKDNYNGGANVSCDVPVTGVAMMKAGGDMSATAAVPRVRPSIVYAPDVKVTQHIETFEVQQMCDAQMAPHGWTCDGSPTGDWNRAALLALRSSANPTPPHSLCESWPQWTASKEYRGYAHIPSWTLVCDAQGVTGISPVDAKFSYGYTRGTEGIWFSDADVYVGDPGGAPVDFNGFVGKTSDDGQCHTLRSQRASRIANADRAVVYQTMGFDQPYVWHELEVEACCDGSVTVRGEHSQFPDARLYIDHTLVATDPGEDLGEFMQMAGPEWSPEGYGVLAPDSSRTLEWSR